MQRYASQCFNVDTAEQYLQSYTHSEIRAFLHATRADGDAPAPAESPTGATAACSGTVRRAQLPAPARSHAGGEPAAG